MVQDYDDRKQAVAFTSRISNPYELNYAAHDLELLGTVGTLQTWRCYLRGQKFIVHTDHQLLKYLEIQ